MTLFEGFQTIKMSMYVTDACHGDGIFFPFKKSEYQRKPFASFKICIGIDQP